MISILPVLPRTLPEPAYHAAGILKELFTKEAQNIEYILANSEAIGSLKDYSDTFEDSRECTKMLVTRTRFLHNFLSSRQKRVPSEAGPTEFLGDYLTHFLKPMYYLQGKIES